MQVKELIDILKEYPQAMETNITTIRATTDQGPLILISDPAHDAPVETVAAPEPKRKAKKG